MLNSANPGNINGEADAKNDTNKESGGIKPAPLVFEAPKPKTSVTGSVSAAEKAKQPEPPVVKAPEPLSKQPAQPQSPHMPPNFSNMPALHEFAPKIVVIGVGGAGNNALNNMIAKELHGVDFLALNTDAQHLSTSLTDQRLQMGVELTRGLGAGANPDAGRM